MLLPHHAKDSTGAKGSSVLLQTLWWGCIAECITSVCCPLVLYSELNVTSTLLNVIGPLLAGAMQAIEDKTTDPLVRQHCICFQSGFITVFTSFAFTTEQVIVQIITPHPLRRQAPSEWVRPHLPRHAAPFVYQAAQLASSTRHGPRQAVAYVLCSLISSCISFAVGQSVLAAALHLARCRGNSCLRAVALQPRRLLRAMWILFGLVWVWVLCTPAGSVFEPMEVIDEGSPGPAAGQRSKLVDVQHLACGLLMQTGGLLLGLRLSQPILGKPATSRTQAPKELPKGEPPILGRSPKG